MKDDPVHQTLRAITQRLRDLGIPHAVAGGMRDAADVQELIRALRLPRDFGQQLNPCVQDQFADLWDGAAADDRAPE